MSGKKRKKQKGKRQGHSCWCCGRIRPNEKFSGRNHSRHLCRDCSKLGREELAYRSARNNLGRCMTWDGIIPRKQRKSFEKFLQHEDPRIRKLAVEMQEEDARERLLRRAENQRDEERLDDMFEASLWPDEIEETSAEDLPPEFGKSNHALF